MQYHSTLLLTLSSFFLNGSTFLLKIKFYYYAYNFKKMTEYFPIKSNTKFESFVNKTQIFFFHCRLYEFYGYCSCLKPSAQGFQLHLHS